VGYDEAPNKANNWLHGTCGYFAVLQNPYSKDKKIIILSGISGPAKHTLAQMLTGCKNESMTMNNYAGCFDKGMAEFYKGYPVKGIQIDINVDPINLM